jgi:hypothetical protein
MPAKTEHPSFKQPENTETSIWRYMDFIKFVSILENEGLFFCRADFLGDPFEGSYARANEELRPTIYEEECKRLNLKMEQWLKALEGAGDVLKWHRQWMMINCWHMSEHESAAMWNLYAKTNGSVCIQSTYGLLVDGLPENAFVGEVQYIDYNKKWMSEGNYFTPFMHKRKSFEYEHEIRAIINKAPKEPRAMMDKTLMPPNEGIWVKVDLSKLIERIYLSPLSPEWLHNLIKQVIKRYGFQMEVNKSSLSEEPFF